MKSRACPALAIFALIQLASALVAFTADSAFAAQLRSTLDRQHLMQIAAQTGSADGGPAITSIPNAITVGGSFTIDGTGFTSGSMVNLFVATAAGPVNGGPLKPSASSSTQLAVTVPTSVSMGEGVAAVQVVNTDQGFAASNPAYAQLQGDPAAGIPTITGLNAAVIHPVSLDPDFAVDAINTVVAQGSPVTINGTGFDTAHGAAVDIFCACPSGKAGPFFILPGDSGLTAASLTFTVPPSGATAPATGPGSFRVTNLGSAKQSNSVAAIIGERIAISSVIQSGCDVTVTGTGFSSSTVINLFNSQPGGAVNLGGFGTDGNPKMPLTLTDSHSFTFVLPSNAMPGPAFVEVLNAPFVPFTDSGTGASGSFTIGTGCSAGCSPHVLLVGGDTDSFISTDRPVTAELYDPAAQTFSSTAGQPTLGNGPCANCVPTNFGNTATALPDGTVLVTGNGTAQLYRPQHSDFISAGSLLDARHNSAVALANGNVFLFALQLGMAGTGTAEIYDWKAGTFTAAGGSFNTISAASLLSNGNLLLLGNATAQLYRPGTNDTVKLGSIPGEATSATPLDDLVLITENGPSPASPTTQLYSTTAGSFGPAGTGGAMSGPPVSFMSATRLGTGGVLFLGGFNNGLGNAPILPEAQLYQPSNDAFMPIPSSNIPCDTACDAAGVCAKTDCASDRALHRGTLLPNGQVLVTGGEVPVQGCASCRFAAPSTAWLFDPATETFSNTAGKMTAPRVGHAAALICQ
jgi:hypothetical protein